jgi:serine/threonine protein kinase
MTRVALSPTLAKARSSPKSTALPAYRRLVCSLFHQYLTRFNSVSTVGGTLRWQAPELMQGAQMLTPEMDVYAFAICCAEILTMGALPWPFVDDDTVRHIVLSGYPLLHYPVFCLRFRGRHANTPPPWMFDQMKTRGRRFRRPMSLTASSGTSFVRAGTAYRRSGPRLRTLHVRSRSGVGNAAPRASTRRWLVCQSRYPLFPTPIIVKIKRALWKWSGTWTIFVLTESPSDSSPIAATKAVTPCTQVTMIPLRHFPELNINCPGFEDTVEWGGANSWPSLSRSHPNMDTAKAPAGFRNVSEDGFTFLCKNPIVVQQAFHM